MAKLFFTLSLTEKPDLNFLDLLVFPFTLSVMYVTLILYESICFLYSVFNELQLNYFAKLYSDLIRCSSLCSSPCIVYRTVMAVDVLDF